MLQLGSPGMSVREPIRVLARLVRFCRLPREAPKEEQIDVMALLQPSSESRRRLDDKVVVDRGRPGRCLRYCSGNLLCVTTRVEDMQWSRHDEARVEQVLG